MENDRRHIPNRLQMYRKRYGYKQQHVAFLLGHTSKNMVSRWENGQAVPSFYNLFKLSIIYSVFPTDLYYDTFKQQQQLIAAKKQLLGMQANE